MSLAELLHLGEELRTLFVTERRAIASLDHAALEQLAVQKRDLAVRLGELRELELKSPEARELFEAIRVEARATAMLAAAATDAVRALLGYEVLGGYDRRARPITSGPSRILAAY